MGYIGGKDATNIVIDGLKTLEYRGYDSAGIALLNDKINVYKSAGRVFELEKIIPNLPSHVGIGHTRWATHGIVCKENAHPHLSFDGSIAIVHNGIIDNSDNLKRELESKHISLLSSTDSEIIAHLLALDSNSAMTDKILNVSKRLRGSVTFLAICTNDDAIYAYKQGASLSIGLGNGENFIASDVPAISKFTENILQLDDGEYAKITKSEVLVFKDGNRIDKSPIKIKCDIPKDCACHMQAEIDEIPFALSRTKESIEIGFDASLREMLTQADCIYLFGCGTAYHACLYGKVVIEKLLHIPCKCVVGGEFDEERFINKNCPCIFVSQSGETADTLLALEYAKSFGAKTIAITNAPTSAIARCADKSLFIDAGVEIAVAATKSYVCQLYALYLIARLASNKNIDDINHLLNAVNDAESIEICHKKIKDARVFFIGKGIDYITAKEGALKLKEITYKSADAYQAGELKHGTIALIDNNSTAIAIVSTQKNKQRIQATISELRSRGAYVIALSSVGETGADITLNLKEIHDELLYPITSIIPLQRLALTTCRALKLNPDKPRNLAKSVTVV